MKARMHFDTLTYANKLKAAGMDPKLVEVQALALVEALDDGVATKGDISQIKTEIATLKSALIQWMVGLFITNITLVGAMIVLTQFVSRSH